MAKNLSHPNQSPGIGDRVTCESVHFTEVEFPKPVTARLVIQFSEGLSLLVADASSVSLAANFITAFRQLENRNLDEGGQR